MSRKPSHSLILILLIVFSGHLNAGLSLSAGNLDDSTDFSLMAAEEGMASHSDHHDFAGSSLQATGMEQPGAHRTAEHDHDCEVLCANCACHCTVLSVLSENILPILSGSAAPNAVSGAPHSATDNLFKPPIAA